VFQTYEPKPIGDALAKVCSTIEAHPHRFAFCPSAPVRQAVLRISSWLAPSLTTVRPCDRPVKKTRDASNRLLPPTRITCTRTSCVPNSLRWLPSADAPWRLRLHTARLGDRMFHDIRDRFGGSSLHTKPRALIPRGLETRAWAFSSHGVHAIEPLTPLSQSFVHPQRFVELPRRCLLLCLGRMPAFLRVDADRGMR
jgi:hypothetical protein